ncbi:uncharacterized protein [Lepisosteus oculatus]|uniref:uncharacterized protein isoform X2 n=1 Tax=Lepisosteus oculatus TaxID=7918 RepID=UPI003723F279
MNPRALCLHAHLLLLLSPVLGGAERGGALACLSGHATDISCSFNETNVCDSIRDCNVTAGACGLFPGYTRVECRVTYDGEGQDCINVTMGKDSKCYNGGKKINSQAEGPACIKAGSLQCTHVFVQQDLGCNHDGRTDFPSCSFLPHGSEGGSLSDWSLSVGVIVGVLAVTIVAGVLVRFRGRGIEYNTGSGNTGDRKGQAGGTWKVQ